MTGSSQTPEGIDEERMLALVITVADDLVVRCLAKGIPPSAVASGVLSSGLVAMCAERGFSATADVLVDVARRLRARSDLVELPPAGSA